ncbi:MAG: hypothetical protein NTY77_13265 [Elusimicrobia bacterium]|nr:hypothetical protein [Elusimicrobiota bacterium]
MRTVGRRTARPLSFSASASLLVEGARFNEDLQRFPAGRLTGIPKGVHRFSTQGEADQFDEDCSARRMAELAQRKT